MSSPEPGPLPQAPPSAEQWQSVPDELWRGVVAHLRRALLDLPESLGTPRTRRLAAAPGSRLRAGRTRRMAEELLAEGGPLWTDVRNRLGADPRLATAIGAALRAPAPATEPDAPERIDDDERDRLRARARELRRERDAAQRRAEGAEARVTVVEAERDRLATELEQVRARVVELEAAVAAASERREADVAREQRRQAGRIEALEQRLRRARREHEELRGRVRATTPPPSPPSSRPAEPDPAPRLVAGRPSRLPDGVRPGTTEAVDALLHRGRRVLVDGYNVTRTQRPDLDLAAQRRWLVDRLGALSAARGLDVTVVFDGSGVQPSGRRERGIMVGFTASGQTADDDLLFRVEALEPDEPVVVVTDDRELRDRVRPYGVDLLRTDEFLWVLR